MTQTHTKGPLTIDPADHLGDPAWAILAADGDYIAVGCLRDDARLLAAAYTSYDKHCGPNAITCAEGDLLGEALAACQLALNAFERNDCIDWNILRDVILKAKGEA